MTKEEINPFVKWRNLQSLKSKELAKQLGVPNSSLSRIENGVQLPSFETLQKYCRLGLDVNSVLLGDSDNLIRTTSNDSEIKTELNYCKTIMSERADLIESLKSQLDLLHRRSTFEQSDISFESDGGS